MNRVLEQKCVMIIAGEASGDLHGSKLVRAMRRKSQSIFFCGIGGQALKNAGVRILIDASELAVVGITEVLSKLPNLIKGMSLAKKLLKSLHPDLLILIDFPDFNFQIASTAKKIGIPVLYYISPQLWAWRSGRVKKIKRLVDHMAVILPFEEDFYRNHNIPVTFVGHPLLDSELPEVKSSYRDRADIVPIIGLLPGSRDSEIRRHLPVMLDAAKILAERIKNIKYIVSLAPGVEKNRIDVVAEECMQTIDLEIETGDVDRIFEKCDLVIAASGTVTLQAAIACVPMVVIYKISLLSYWLGRTMIRVEHISLANLIADKRVVPELLQNQASSGNIADMVFEMINDADGIRNLRKELSNIRDTLGGSGASERVADIAVSMM